MAKALGSEIKEFYDTAWPEGWYHDDSSIDFYKQDRDPKGFGEVWALEDEEKYDLRECGVLIHEKTEEVVDFSRVFSRWKKSKTTVTLYVSIPKDLESEVKMWLKNKGCTIA